MKKIVAYRIVEPAPRPARLWISFALALLVVILLLGQPAHAQDVTEPIPTEEPTVFVTVAPEPTVVVEPTAEPTPEPPPVIVDQVNFRVGIFGMIAIVGTLILSGFGIGAIWGHIRASKQFKDESERLYLALSPDAQAKIDLAYQQSQRAWDKVDEFARQALALWGQVIDGKPNDAAS